MKNFTFLAFAAFFSFLVTNRTYAQKTDRNENVTRCATMERAKLIVDNNPGLREAAEARAKIVSGGTLLTNYRLQAIVTVPVVVHIVLPNPWIVTDADVQTQIDRLNLDFSGLNPDSTNAGSFTSLRGHSQIQFCLARRTPGGQVTNGIERKASATGSNATIAVDPIKRASQGGLDVWDPTSYMNLWIGVDVSGFGILGYAQFPGTGLPADDGVFLNYQSFGSSSCYTLAGYNRGRTGSHEVGHYFGLLHIWGDEAGCTGDDFHGLHDDPSIASTCILPAGLYNPAGQGNTAADIGDTPNQGNATTTCPSGVSTDACATAAPGKMYQNYMDYTLDACYSMFTKKQVQRMEWVVDNCRAGLKTSLGCQPPASAILLDAAPLHAVNPGGFELSGCNIVSYPSTLSCGSFTPKFRLVNNGFTTLTSVTVGYKLDVNAAVTQTATVNLPVGGFTVVTLPAVSTIPGSHTIKFFTSAPNGAVDQVPANDTLVQNFTVAAAVALPQSADFESATFPPANWTIVNPNNNFTWQRKTPGRNGSAGAMWVDNYNNNAPNQTDELRTSNINVAGASSVTISFDLAHKYYPAAPYDTLTVLVSNDCGVTWQTVYKKWSTTLATAGSSTGAYTTPAAADWRTETIPLSGAILTPGQLIVSFMNTNNYGNNIFIDNINIAAPASRDLKLVSINNPGATACSPNIAPQVVVNNNGLETITAFNVGYRLNGGANNIQSFTQTIAPGANATITLPAGTGIVGANTITAFVASPTSVSGTGDSNTSNDTLSRSFTVLTLQNPPVVEGFENAFPPTGWTINNPNNNVTWTRKAPGNNSANAAFIDNFNNATIGQIDEMKTPFLNVAGADSISFSFDLAHKNYPGASDKLEILASTDCGNTYTSVYSRAGAALATAGSSNANYAAPIATDWKTQSIVLNNTFSASGSIGFIVRNTNDYGNNIFVDNINISSVYKRDIQLVSINTPGTVICSGSLTPAVTVKNVGIETITGLKVSYSIDGGAVATTTVTGLTLARNASANVALTALTINAVGQHNIKVYSWDPVSASGTGDFYTKNDTLSKQFFLAGTVPAPLTQDFTGTAFPPPGWSVINPDGGITWSRNAVGNGNVGSAYVNTYYYSKNGERDDLVSPNVTFQGVDSVGLKFDLAASTYSYPGSTAIPIDTLTVLVTKDCGNTFTTVYQKWGEDLQTIKDPNNAQTGEFIPQFGSQWRTETVDLTGLGGQGPLMLFFRVSNNYENNIFIDNVNLTTRTLPDRIKQQGYLVLPTPFQNSFNVWHVQTPSTLKYISVYNSAGQLVWTKQYSGNAQKVEAVNLYGKAAGMYLVKLGYEDENRNVSERVIKY